MIWFGRFHLTYWQQIPTSLSHTCFYFQLTATNSDVELKPRHFCSSAKATTKVKNKWTCCILVCTDGSLCTKFTEQECGFLFTVCVSVVMTERTSFQIECDPLRPKNLRQKVLQRNRLEKQRWLGNDYFGLFVCCAGNNWLIKLCCVLYLTVNNRQVLSWIFNSLFSQNKIAYLLIGSAMIPFFLQLVT